MEASYEIAKKDYPITLEKDDLLERIQAIIQDRTGAPFSLDDEKNATKEGKRRIEEKIPPGYKDADKGNGNQCGDYMIWKQVLDKLAECHQHAVFVSNDQKEDWVLIVGGKKIGPRPELRKELYETCEKEIAFTSLEYFTKWAREKYSLEVQNQEEYDEAIREVSSDTLSKAFQSFQASLERPRKAVEHFMDTQKIFKNTLNQVSNKELFDSYRRLTENARHINELRCQLSREELGDKAFSLAVQEIVTWFFSHYLDPSDTLGDALYDAEKDRYLCTSGPYYAKEVIMEQFPRVSDYVIKEALSIIDQQGGPQWVRIEDG